MPSSSLISNKKLYQKVIEDAKKRFKVWPSAYASGWVVRRYKELGGTYTESTKSVDKKGLSRWYRQEWINVCELPKIVPCGRHKASIDATYPYCRPRKRVTEETPKTAGQMSAQDMKKLCTKKKKYPLEKVFKAD